VDGRTNRPRPGGSGHDRRHPGSRHEIATTADQVPTDARHVAGAPRSIPGETIIHEPADAVRSGVRRL